ncbi:hypothetical protein F383_27424 [Gossypium arboreum]|uniref:Uncharacterized protein n=1 Tax=Gossypium arboreum TaxID=29729 RepID=A0A0B0PBX6_GOSAR|nr:hypothetical protein F383_27424 [Gossypium arboreum]
MGNPDVRCTVHGSAYLR